MLQPVKALETAWSSLCLDAGWTADLNCSPNLKQLHGYYARLDALAAERQASLRGLIGAARKAAAAFDRHYVDGIEAALGRAIEAPRGDA